MTKVKSESEEITTQLLSALLSGSLPQKETERESPKDERIFYHLADNVDQEQVKAISAMLYQGKTTDAKTFLLYITSNGGGIDCGLAIYDMLRTTSLKIVTVMSGNCDSIAKTVFLSGDLRLVSPNVSALFHLPLLTFHTDTSIDLSELNYLLKDLENDFKRIQKLVAGRTGISAKKFLALCKEKRRLYAKDLVHYGFAHKIVKPSKSKNKRP